MKKIWCMALKRCPTAAELQNSLNIYTQSGYKCREVFAQIMTTQEFFNKYLAATFPTNTVNELYQMLLGRAPDPSKNPRLIILQNF